MANERWQRAKVVFQGALERPLEGRTTYVVAACGEDLELRGEVESLLASHAEATGFLSRPAVEQAGLSPSGRRIGPYSVLDEIAHGGMGSVYRAVRDDDAFRKTVALKLMHRGGSGSEFLNRRFQQERQILAGLQHPNIATILDGGATEDGQPFLVMEHVEGRPLTIYCDEAGLGLRARLELFRSVCGAVQYAHQNLVVHRDIKPPNILVTADGMPKLLDFGIAKLLAAGVESEYAPTATLLPMMTPEYASPEQVRGEAVTTTSDVYSLGVVLYELLVGQRPYEVKTHSLEEIVRTVCDTAPLPPSAALRTRLADREGPAPTTQASELRGDLDTIVMKALHKDPSRRYGSAQELSEDVRRYLVGLPVLARPDTLRYRAAKFVARHKPGVAASTLVALLIVGFALNASLQSVRIRKEKDKAERVSSFLVRLFDFADPGSSGAHDVKAREILDKGVERIHSELKDEPEVRATLLDTMGTVYKSLAQYDKSEALLREALAIRKQVLGRHPDVAKTSMNLGVLLWRKGQYGEAETLMREALALERQLVGPEHKDVTVILSNLASVLGDKGEAAESEAMYKQALALRRRLKIEKDTQLPMMIQNVANAALDHGDYAGAEALYREALEMQRANLGNDHANVARSTAHLASFLEDKGDYAAAERLYRESLAGLRKAFGEEHRWVAFAMGDLARLLGRKGDYSEAVELARGGLAMERKVLGAGHSHVATILGILAAILDDQGQRVEAESLVREGLALSRAALGDEHTQVAALWEELADILRGAGKLADAEAAYRTALAMDRKLSGPKHHSTAGPLTGLGELQLQRQDPAAAEPLLREAVAVRQAALPKDHTDTAEAESALGACLTAQGRFAEAEPLLTGSDTLLEAKLSSRSRAAREAHQRLVKLYTAWGKPAEAGRYAGALARAKLGYRAQ